MRSKLFLVLTAALLLAPASSAAEETVDLGAYLATFNLTSSKNCTILVAEPVEGRTPTGTEYVERSIALECEDGRAEIRIAKYVSPVPAGDGVTRALSKETPWGIGCIGIETAARLVDRHTGYLTTFSLASGGEVHQAAYWLDRYLAPGDYQGETSCVISSSLPWEATKELLDTAHVERKPEAALNGSTGETVTAGPYAVSFDLGDQNYTVSQVGPEPGEAEDSLGLERQRIILDSGTRAATITITSYDDFRTVNLDTERLLAEAILATEGYTNNNASDRTIGGVAGVLGVGEDDDHQILYAAIYWPDQVQAEEGQVIGMIRCEVESSFWWNTTERLLDTISVERIEET